MRTTVFLFFYLLCFFFFSPLNSQEEDTEQGFLPKEEMGILEHLKEYPTHDGRNVIVAVIDTGVDLKHPGLQKTSTGQRKIIDFYDATGAGLIPCSVRIAPQNGKVIGLSGYELNLSHLPLQGKTVQLGVIHSAEVFPARAVRRIINQKKNQLRNQKQNKKEKQFGKKLKENKEKEELSSLEFSGYHFDVIVFDSPAGKRAIIDTDNDGDLKEEQILQDFTTAGDVITFQKGYQLNAGIKIHPDGNQIELLFDGGGHGTHVAGIIGAYYKDGDPLNGLAPGIQIISIKIGNNLYGGATTDLSLIKAVDYAVRKGAHIINCSFGGPSFENNGHEISSIFVNKMLEKHRFLMCISAGNNGPALGTVGSPGTSELAFAVGACVSPKTQNSNYGVVDVVPSLMFPFSSRGPMNNGEVGVDFIAPGAAYSPLPSWHLIKHENWNGTSMAAPQLSGALSVLLSGLMAEKIDWNLTRIRNALERTAQPLEEVSFLEQGSGVPQIPQAFKLIQEEKEQASPLHYRLSFQHQGRTYRGAFFKNIEKVEPLFFNFRATPLSPKKTTNFSRQLALTSEVPWMKVATRGMVTKEGASIRVKILPHLLQPGVNFGRIIASRIDGFNPGFEFWFPVTIFQPSENQLKSEYSINIKSGARKSFLFEIPSWATHFHLTARDVLHPNHYQIGIRILSHWQGAGENNFRFWKNLDEKIEQMLVKVLPGNLLELALQAQFMQNQNGLLGLKPLFLGLESDQKKIVAAGGVDGVVLGLAARGTNLKGELSGSLTHEVEDLSLQWTITKDPHHPDLLTNQVLFLQKGVVSFKLNHKEKILLRTPTHPFFFDFFDDAYLTIKDENQRVQYRDHITKGSFQFEAKSAGLHTLTIFVVTVGQKVRASEILAVELNRPIAGKPIQIFKTPFDGLTKKSEAKRLSLAENESTIRYLKFKHLQSNKRYRGTVTFKEDYFGTLLELPVLVLERNIVSQTIAKKWQQEDVEKQWNIAIEKNPKEAESLLEKMKNLGVASAEDLLKFKVLTNLKKEPAVLQELEALYQETQQKIKQHPLKNAKEVQKVAVWIGWSVRLLQRMGKEKEATTLLQQWQHLDFNNYHFLYFNYAMAEKNKNYFSALKYLKEIEKRTGFQLKSRIEIYQKLGWNYAIQKLLPEYLVHYPNKTNDYLELLKKYQSELGKATKLKKTIGMFKAATKALQKRIVMKSSLKK